MELFLLLAFTHLAFSLLLTIFAGCPSPTHSVPDFSVTWFSPRFIGNIQPSDY